MTEPRRLLDLEGAASDLLRTATSDAPSAASRQAVRAALEASLAAGAAGAVAQASISKVLTKWLLAVPVAGAIGVGATIWLQERSPSFSAPVAPPVHLPAPVAPPAPLFAAPVPAPTSAPVPPLEAVRPAERRRRPMRMAPSDSLGQEMQLLDSARQALGHRDSTAALRLLDRYREQFRSGVLHPESVALRIEALLVRGDRAQASELADRFTAQYPQSPLRARIERLRKQSTEQ